MKLSRGWLTTLAVVALGALLVLPSLGIGLGTLLTFFLILLCPLSHLFMMRGGHGGQGGHDHGTMVNGRAADAQTSLPVDEKKALDG